MTIRAVLVAILVVALGLGALMWWLQTRAFYREVTAEAAGGVEVATLAGDRQALPFADFRAIDSDSSPIRFRACLTLEQPAEAVAAIAAVARPYERPTPLTAPGWFDCFDAPAIGEALEAGEARAYLAVPDLRYGIDRVLAVFPDGRAYLWNQINRCGEAVFNGNPPPEGCPPPPEDARLDYAPDEA